MILRDQRGTLEKLTWRQRCGLRVCVYKPKHTKDCWLSPEAGEGHGADSLLGLPEGTNLQTPRSQTPSLQNWEKKVSVVLSPPVVLFFGQHQEMEDDTELASFILATMRGDTEGARACTAHGQRVSGAFLSKTVQPQLGSSHVTCPESQGAGLDGLLAQLWPEAPDGDRVKHIRTVAPLSPHPPAGQ